MFRYKRLLLILFCIISLSNSFHNNFIKSSILFKNRQSNISKIKLNVIEHLIDCANNPTLAELYGGVGSEYCFQPDGGTANNIKGFLDELFTISFLVISYYAFKRQDLWRFEEDENSKYEDNYNNIYSNLYKNKKQTGKKSDLFGSSTASSRERERGGERRVSCPQCDGRGVLSWKGRLTMCDLCNGKGDIPNFKVRRNLPVLPRERERESDREIYREDDDY